MKSPNPFSTRFFQPGAIDYAFLSHGCWDRILDECLSDLRCKLIVGPHGTGKSTFVRSLIPKLEERLLGGRVHLLQLSSDGSASRLAREDVSNWLSSRVVIIDGIEQLSWLRRCRIIRFCRRNKIHLMATAHCVLNGCQVLWRTAMDQQTERRVLETIFVGYDPSLVDTAMQSEAWRLSRARHGENLRESLFDMYDWWQQQD